MKDPLIDEYNKKVNDACRKDMCDRNHTTNNNSCIRMTSEVMGGGALLSGAAGLYSDSPAGDLSEWQFGRGSGSYRHGSNSDGSDLQLVDCVPAIQLQHVVRFDVLGRQGTADAMNGLIQAWNDFATLP